MKYFGAVLFDPSAPDEPYCWCSGKSPEERDRFVTSQLDRGFRLIQKLDVEYEGEAK